MTVGELLSRISSRELTEWMAFDRLEPIGSEPDRLQMAQLIAIMANANRDPKRHRQPFQVEDFMPRREPAVAEPEQSPEDHEAILRMWQSVLAARDARG